MKVPFLDLSIHDEEQLQNYLGVCERVFRHGRLVMGPEVSQFESDIAIYCKTKRAVAVSSGTDALFLTLKLLGIGPGDEVIIPAMSFVATANAVRLNGADVVVADVEDDFNISPKSMEKLITARTKAVIPVHYGGKIAKMSKILSIAQAYGLEVIEDASQAFGAKQDEKIAGTLAPIGCISLNPMKILGAFGEMGVIVTNNDKWADHLEALRYNGVHQQKSCIEVSSNCKPDTLQAALLIEKLKLVDQIINQRRANAEFLRNALHEYCICPYDDEGASDVYYTFTVLIEKRDELQSFLQDRNIESKVYHPVLTNEPAYSKVIGEYENAMKLTRSKLALPVNETVSKEQLEYITESVIEFFKET
ncbi:DegT/DnrJ/EryC1/StrS family aminotransferase [Lentisphaera marina]|uniref:DegT/DnrJ/EryC1/StrS family aminotransferase n=1 Tax=Lentisphaera marina TaxID=1111041 RepID=UPI002365A363|nr:DegT/DnrJ/EryC1/StrS family aminotransferase [Lentisphaera marina]MDD7985730.1 DegT/DnrJ/EryC1/StrS family aminotransferase [Lentisphaera marina]